MLHHFQNVILILVDQGLHEELLEIFFEREINHDIDRVFALRGRDLGNRAIRWCRPVERENPVVVRAARFRTHRALLVTRSFVGRLHQLGRVSGLRRAASCSASGSLRISRHAGIRSNGMLVSNDSSTLSDRLWTWTNIRPPAAAVSSAVSKYRRQ